MPYFPPDSRYLTEWRSSCQITNDLATQAKTSNSKDLSTWLHKNAKMVQDQGMSKVMEDLKKFSS
jgi:hypothetical protein